MTLPEFIAIKVTSISFHKKLASLLAANFTEDFIKMSSSLHNHDLDCQVYEHLDMTSLNIMKAWSANRTDRYYQDYSFSGLS